MVIAGTINRVAFYCRVNHRDRDYEKYLDDVMRRLEEEYGKQKWDLPVSYTHLSFSIAAGSSALIPPMPVLRILSSSP